MQMSSIDQSSVRPRDQGEHAAFMQALERRIDRHLSQSGPVPIRLVEAARDAMASGKRIRPYLLHLVAGAQASPDAVMDMAVALEMVHSASLVVDDLPSMDNASLRRGRPTTHAVFGEATAILTAIGLLNHAIAIASQLPGVRADQRIVLVGILSQVIGWQGLVAGQELDLNGFSEADTVLGDSLGRITRINALKTGVPLCAAVEAGAVLGDRQDGTRVLLKRFGADLGQAFQIADDLADLLHDSQRTGKDCQKDVGKETFLAVFGLNEAVRRCRALLRSADEALVESGLEPHPFRSLIGRLFDPMLSSVPVQPEPAARMARP